MPDQDTLHDRTTQRFDDWLREYLEQPREPRGHDPTIIVNIYLQIHSELEEQRGLLLCRAQHQLGQFLTNRV
jgi:hypothetical protein